ncbi:MAG: DUF2933 domain-containing protein [Patescibacteria group bacterium]
MNSKGFSRVSKIITVCILLLLAVFILPKYFPALKGNGLFLILLLCPLMHIFMMGKHGDHGKQGGSHSCCGGSKEPEQDATPVNPEHKHEIK